jgi:hypothetical protein
MLLQLSQRLTLLPFKLQRTPDGPGIDVIDEFDAFGFGFLDPIAEGNIIGHFNEKLQVFYSVKLPVIAGREDAHAIGKEESLGLGVDIGNPENGGAAVHKIFIVQVFEKNFTETAATDNGNVGIQ